VALLPELPIEEGRHSICGDIDELYEDYVSKQIGQMESQILIPKVFNL